MISVDFVLLFFFSSNNRWQWQYTTANRFWRGSSICGNQKFSVVLAHTTQSKQFKCWISGWWSQQSVAIIARTEFDGWIMVRDPAAMLHFNRPGQRRNITIREFANRASKVDSHRLTIADNSFYKCTPFSVFHSMSVYHSIRSSTQLENSVDETVDQDGMVLVDINSTEDEPTEIIQPELNRASGQVNFILCSCGQRKTCLIWIVLTNWHRQHVAFHAFKTMWIIWPLNKWSKSLHWSIHKDCTTKRIASRCAATPWNVVTKCAKQIARVVVKSALTWLTAKWSVAPTIIVNAKHFFSLT